MKILLSILLLANAVPSFGQWSGDPATNTPICVAPDYQDLPQLVSDGSSGAIITWLDWRNGPGDIYAQRIGANGFVQWTADGVSVCGAASTQNRPMIVADGSGGAILFGKIYGMVAPTTFMCNESIQAALLNGPQMGFRFAQQLADKTAR